MSERVSESECRHNNLSYKMFVNIAARGKSNPSYLSQFLPEKAVSSDTSKIFDFYLLIGCLSLEYHKQMSLSHKQVSVAVVVLLVVVVVVLIRIFRIFSET